MKLIPMKKNSGYWQRRKFTSEQGSSLLEVTVSMLIATVGLLGMAQLIAVSTMATKNGSNLVESARAAQNAIEPIRAKDFSTVETGTTRATYKDRFYVTTTVTADSNSAKKIAVTVVDTNYDMKGGSRKFTFSNYRTNDKAAMGGYYNSALTPEKAVPTANTTPTPTSSNTSGS